MAVIFFSWQSHTRSKAVDKVVTRAVKELNSKSNHEFGEFKLQRGPGGEPGWYDLMETIEARIDSADLVIGDMTPIAAENGHVYCNSNVMYELGYARSRLSHKAIIPIISLDDFSNYQPEALPFDIRGKNAPLTVSQETFSSDIRTVCSAILNNLQTLPEVFPVFRPTHETTLREFLFSSSANTLEMIPTSQNRLSFEIALAPNNLTKGNFRLREAGSHPFYGYPHGYNLPFHLKSGIPRNGHDISYYNNAGQGDITTTATMRDDGLITLGIHLSTFNEEVSSHLNYERLFSYFYNAILRVIMHLRDLGTADEFLAIAHLHSTSITIPVAVTTPVILNKLSGKAQMAQLLAPLKHLDEAFYSLADSST